MVTESIAATDAATADLDTIGSVLDSVYERKPLDEHVAVVHGFGTAVRVRNNQLELTDGIGRHRRERRYGQSDRTLQRIVITSPDGYVSLEALRYCASHGISVTMFNADNELVTHYATAPRIPSPKLLRTQVLSADVKAVPVTKALLARKVTGQGDVLLKHFNDADTAAKLYHYASEMQSAETLAELNDLERFAARDYFDSWTGRAEVRWTDKARERVPASWLMFQKRKMSASRENTKRHASDPINAMLNYAYALGYAEARAACIAVGLNPALGFNHVDKPGRDALALDVLEVLRPEIDACVLSLLETRVFTHRDFHEPRGSEFPPGTVRIVAPLLHELAEASRQLERTALEATRIVVGILNSTDMHTATVKSLSLSNQRAEFISRPVDVATILPDAAWKEMRLLLPEKSPHSFNSIDNRTVLAAFIYLHRHNKPLAYVPDLFGISRRTLEERRLRWTRQGRWEAIQTAIRDQAAKLGQ